MQAVYESGGVPVHRALCATGHAWITTTLQSYIGDPAIPLALSEKGARLGMV